MLSSSAEAAGPARHGEMKKKKRMRRGPVASPGPSAMAVAVASQVRLSHLPDTHVDPSAIVCTYALLIRALFLSVLNKCSLHGLMGDRARIFQSGCNFFMPLCYYMIWAVYYAALIALRRYK